MKKYTVTQRVTTKGRVYIETVDIEGNGIVNALYNLGKKPIDNQTTKIEVLSCVAWRQ